MYVDSDQDLGSGAYGSVRLYQFRGARRNPLEDPPRRVAVKMIPKEAGY